MPNAVRSTRIVPPDILKAASKLLLLNKTCRQRLYNEVQGEWPAEDRAAISDLLTVLNAARIRAWRAPGKAPQPGTALLRYVLQTTHKTSNTSHHDLVIQLAADGRIGIPSRGIVGLVDEDTRDAWFGE